MEFLIRKAELTDLEAIVDLWRKLSKDQLGKDKYYKGQRLEFTGGNKQFTDSLSNPNCCIFVAVSESIVIGFIEVWLYDADFHFFADDYAYILHYYIEPQARKNELIYKLMSNLYQAAEDWAKDRGSKYLVADVFEHNEKVVHMLQREKFSIYRYRLAKEI